jgi:rubrerythrin
MLLFVTHTTIHPFVPKVSRTTVVILASMYFPTPSGTEPAYFYEDDDEYTSGYTYIFRSFDDFLSQFFGPDIGELRRRAAADEADWKQKEAVRKKLRDEKQRKEEEAEERRQARANAKMYEEEEKRQSKEMRAQQEKLLQEERWSDMNATTEAEKRRTCLHSAFWPKEQQKRKLKCQSCGKKGGMIAFKCPHCSLLACQLCLNKLAKRTT